MDRERNADKPFRNKKKKKVCQFCAENAEKIDYKDTVKLRKCISERSKRCGQFCNRFFAERGRI